MASGGMPWWLLQLVAMEMEPQPLSRRRLPHLLCLSLVLGSTGVVEHVGRLHGWVMPINALCWLPSEELQQLDGQNERLL